MPGKQRRPEAVKWIWSNHETYSHQGNQPARRAQLQHRTALLPLFSLSPAIPTAPAKKSSIANAIRLALTGRPARGIGRRDYISLVTPRIEERRASVSWMSNEGGGTCVMRMPAGKHIGEAPANTLCLDIGLEPSAFRAPARQGPRRPSVFARSRRSFAERQIGSREK